MDQNYKRWCCILPLRRINIFQWYFLKTKVFPVSLVKSWLLTFRFCMPNTFTETLTRLSSYTHYFLMDLDAGDVWKWNSFSALHNSPSLACRVLWNYYAQRHLKHFQNDMLLFLPWNSSTSIIYCSNILAVYFKYSNINAVIPPPLSLSLSPLYSKSQSEWDHAFF